MFFEVDRLFVHFSGVQHRTSLTVAKRTPDEMMPRQVTLRNPQFLSNIKTQAACRPHSVFVNLKH